MILRHLLNSFFPPITSFEWSIVRELERQLDDKAADALVSQFKEINFVQRHRSDREICFYKIKKLRVSDQRLIKFESQGEKLLCNCLLLLDNKQVTLDVWLVDGNLFSFEFSDDVSIYRKYETVKVNIQ